MTPIFFPARVIEENNEKDKSEEAGEFYSISSSSTYLIACSSQVEDNCNNHDDNDKDVNFQCGCYNCNEDSDDSSLVGKVLVDGQEELYYW